jgi:hypothetical protein
LTANYTIEFYFKWDYTYTGELGNLFYADQAAFARSYLVDHGASPATYQVQYGMRKDNGDWATIITPADSTLNNAWHHLAFTRTWDGTNTGYAIYVDGNFSVGGSFAQGFNDPGLNLYMPFGSSMGGTFDEIRISNVARTEFGVGPDGGFYDNSDISRDYKVDFKDFALLAKEWMTCSDPAGLNCVNCNELVFVASTIDANTVALWHLDEGTGNTAYDETANHYAFTLNAGTGTEYTWSLGRFTQGLYAPNGNTSYCKSAALPIANTSNITNQMSISAWVRPNNVLPDSNDSYAVITDTSSFIRFSRTGAGPIYVQGGFYTWANQGTWVQAAREIGTMFDGEWHHVAAVYDGIPDESGNANVYLYWDGVLAGTTSIAANTDIEPGHEGRVGLTLVDTGTGELQIGSSVGGQAYRGYIDEVKVDNTARTSFFGTACD